MRLRQLLVFPRYTLVTVIVSMGLTSVPMQELSSVYQFIDVLIQSTLGGIDERLMEFYDPLLALDFIKSDSIVH